MKLNSKALQNELAVLKAELANMVALADEDREERIRDAKVDFRCFCETYFPHHCKDQSSAFHEWIFEQAPQWGPGARHDIAAPRGNAKTTYLARLYPLWKRIRGDTRNTIIVQAATEEAEQSLAVIKTELEDNARLQADFPNECTPGDRWRQRQFSTLAGWHCRAYGAGKKLRGANWKGNRPDLIVLDDLEDDVLVRSKERRDALWSWFTGAVLPLGPPDGSAIILYIGTRLHHDAILCRAGKRPDFRETVFKALVQFPQNMKLWEQWEALYHTDPEVAEDFYLSNKRIMDAGAVVLWPAVQPLYLLMCIRAADRNAFAKEYQNEPTDAALLIFPPEHFHYYTELPPLVAAVGACDPALGKARGDFTALIVLGRDKPGLVYVLEADIARIKPDEAIEKIIAFQRQYACIRWIFEEVAFQEFFKDVVITRSREARCPIPAVGVKPSAPKDIRIESLAPHTKAGTILFHQRHTLLLDQLQEYPAASHDDGPDALHMAFSNIYSAAPLGGIQTPGTSQGGLLSRLSRWAGKGF